MGDASLLSISSPKRNRRLGTGWEGFFPYYAGYPEGFAEALLKSAALVPGSVILDPWNGSGTTAYVAGQIGLKGIGLDINPAMVVVARARLLAPTEADSLEPLGKKILEAARSNGALEDKDPLLSWFTPQASVDIRSIERSICSHLVGGVSAVTPLEHLSHLASAVYVSLFAVCRALVRRFYSSNPTWIRLPKAGEKKVRVTRSVIERHFLRELAAMAKALSETLDTGQWEPSLSEVRLADSANLDLPKGSIDLILSSPPYCTRIDYTSATRIELALIDPLVRVGFEELGRTMLGSVRVPKNEISIAASWGAKCQSFLDKVATHPSKASSGYYLRTHLDYFHKLSLSLDQLSSVLKPNGRAIFVVQDSYYKDVHNDLPGIFVEIAGARSLSLTQREDFYSNRSMSGINPNSKLYKRKPGAIELVLCFRRN